MREVCRRIGLAYSPVNIKFDALLVGLMADQYDITSESMDITPTRQKQVAFADGWLESGARIVTRKDTGIKGPEDLVGKRGGVPEYSMTAAVYMRGLLQHEYGVTPDRVEWLQGREDRIKIDLPDNVIHQPTFHNE